MQLFDEPRGRKRPAGYLPLFDDATLRDEPVSESEVTPQERDAILQQIGELTGGTVSRVADTLAAPGDYARGVMAGKPGERVGGRDLLREYGLASQDDNWPTSFRERPLRHSPIRSPSCPVPPPP